MAFTEQGTFGDFNGTTQITLVSAPASDTRHIVRSIIVYNADTVAATVHIKHYDGSTARTLWKVTLQTGETLTIDTPIVLEASESLVAVLGGAITTTNPRYVTAYAEVA